MKFRQGFVSNSSTTSFCICGICLDQGELESLLKDKMNKDDDIYELMESFCCPKDVYFNCEPYADYYYIGLEVEKMDDKETMGDFKNKAKEKLKELFGDDFTKKVRVITAGWRDG